MKQLQEKSNASLETIATKATRWIGSTRSLAVHTILFITSFSLYFFGFAIDKILLVLTTILSLEAIYLSIFIQMSVNKQAEDLSEVAQDVEEIQEDVDEIQKDVDEIQEDVEGIEKDVEEIQEDVEGIEGDVDELSTDIDEVGELDQKRDEFMLSRIEGTLQIMIKEINDLKAAKPKPRKSKTTTK
jgi:septal ring factor EnvC (AmiA/AmiB activator)